MNIEKSTDKSHQEIQGLRKHMMKQFGKKSLYRTSHNLLIEFFALKIDFRLVFQEIIIWSKFYLL